MAVFARTATVSTGRAQAARSSSARARRPNLSAYYGRTLPDIEPGAFEFRLDLLRGSKATPIPLDNDVESFEWVDEQAALTGNLQLHRPDPNDWASLPIGKGHQVKCRVRWAGRWYELWTMRCGAPEVTVDTNTVSVDLTDDVGLVRAGHRRYLYRATKRRPQGWYGHEALRDAARKDGIRLGAITRCTTRMKKIDVTGSFLDLATKVYEHERDQTARRFVLRMRDGLFEAVPYRRNRLLYVLVAELRSAVLTQVPKVENPSTVITGTARLGKGKHAKKLRHTEYRRDVVDRLGYSHKTKDYGRVDSLAELKSKVRVDLAKQLAVDRNVTVQFQGIPFLRRGDGAQVVLPSDRMTGNDSFVFATAMRHQVQQGTYTSEGDFTTVDPFEAAREAYEKALIAKKAAARKKAKT